MSSKALSPTASILRSSRLFSLPPPLPRPAPELSLGVSFNSDTATTPYPTQAAIVTTQSASSRGDWGLKRPLPLRSTTKTSTPVIRVHAIDSPQHITDYSSASDHVLTLRKWQELHLSISIAQPRESFAPPVSAFESEVDRTLEVPRTTFKGDVGRRWKFAGPWLGGQTRDEFERYLDRRVRTRKREFRELLRQQVKWKKVGEERLKHQAAEGVDEEASAVEVLDKEIDVELRRLRQDPSIIELSKLARSFLDLPTLPDSSGESGAYDRTGPPLTHPSAGLSYLRTHAVLPNHPFRGPQARSAPVEARILVPRQTGSGYGGKPAALGVAGVVTVESGTGTNTTFSDNSTGQPRAIKKWDTTSSGGGKAWLHPSQAAVDAHGRINLYTYYKSELSKGDSSKGDGKDRGFIPPPSRNRSVADITSSILSTSKRPGGYGVEGAFGSRNRSSQPTTPVSDAMRSPHQAIEDIGSR
ncbi:MAG: hypothetical protein M1816_000018 [Peltula sp. TS41687]|nr:MAG: hypothetical protein M1816_000018 [Peltula sp. TS41687]